MVKLITPLPGTRVEEEKEADTPAGCPLTARARLFGSVPTEALQVSRTLVPPPTFRDNCAGVAAKAQLSGIGVTVRAMAAVVVSPAPLAVTMTL
jgi:hypothetical protein